MGDVNPMEIAAVDAADDDADPGGAGQPQGDGDFEINERDVFGDGDGTVAAEAAAPDAAPAAPAAARPGDVTPPLGGVAVEATGQPAGAGVARLPQSATTRTLDQPSASLAPPAPQHAVPNPMTYEAWSAKDFAIVLIMVWAGLALPLANALIEHLGFEDTDHARVVAGSPFTELLEAFIRVYL